MMSRDPKSEQERREQEISMFAAMALGSEWDPNGAAASTLKKDNDDNDDGDLIKTSSPHAPQSPAPKTISRSRSAEEDDEKGNLPPPTNQKGRQSWMKRLRGNRDKVLTPKKDNSPANEKEEEISAVEGDSTPRTSVRKSVQKESESTYTPQSSENAAKPANSSPSDTDNPFSVLAMAEDSSGTFAFHGNNDANSMEKSNFAAALAAIEKEASGTNNNNQNDHNQHSIHHIGSQANGGQSPVKPQVRMPPEEPASMFAEQVIMPRPLFFGPIVSPRIVRQARQLVLDATKDNKSGAPPRLQDLPGSVRNVVCALKLYGYGIDVLNDLKEDEDGVEFWRGNGYVNTYQPLWGDEERTDRIKEIQRQQEKALSSTPKPSQLRLRSITAPGRLAPTQKPEGDSSLLGQSLFTGFTGVVDDGKEDANNITKDQTFGLDKPSGTAAGESTSEHEANSRGTLSTNSITNDSGLVTNQSWLENRQGSTDSSDPIQASANEQFTAWIRGDDSGLSSSFGQAQLTRDGSWNANESKDSWNSRRTDDSSSAVKVDTDSKTNSEQELFSQCARGETTNKTHDPSTDLRFDAEKDVSTEQALFSQWARGETGGAVSASSSAGSGSASSSSLLGTELGNGYNTNTFSTMTDNAGGTFQRRPIQSMVDSDDDSVEHDERKKQVGLNDHLSKALASLSEESSQPQPIEVVDESELRLSDVSLDGARRPLTNYELTNGCVPVYGVDDPPLPVEGDLGIHETKEEQQKSQEQKRMQEVVGFVKPNIFNSIACPDPSLNPDDFQSWNARVVGNQRLVPATAATGSLDNLSGYAGQQQAPLTPQQNSHSRSHQSPKQHHSPQSSEASPRSEQGSVMRHQRQNSYGRISRSSERESSMSSDPAGRPPKSASKKSKHKRKLSSKTRYGWWNVGDPNSWPSTITAKNKEIEGTGPVDLDVVADATNLYLPPLQHSATTLSTVTQLEPFPGELQKENLPLSRMHAATSMAQSLPFLSDRNPNFRFLQVDTQAVGFPPLGGEVEPLHCSLCIYNIETATTSPGGAPMPDLQRCGRISESLHFEFCSDEGVARACEGVLWPYELSSPFADMLNVVNPNDAPLTSQKRIGTRCGVFPIPTNFSFSKLYAVLIVKKVLSDQNVDIYLKGGSKNSELAKQRENAARAASRQSPFLVPFAFGVAPLLQVFGGGSENPVMTSSRAVQIPLFRFSPGNGESQIIDHIMVMLSPREHRSSGAANPVTPTNGGTAMLVMRNFGYLGLHRVVDEGSSLARDRLVDFSGELQLRRKTDQERGSKFDSKMIDGCSTTLPEWRPEYIAEPVLQGGRYVEDAAENFSPTESVRYAQELSPIKLQVSPSVRLPPPAPQSTGSRSKSGRGHDVEPFYHTTFCNEMVLYPKLLRACPKGNIVVKTELRELEWNETITAYVAHLPSCGPSFHNNRRGPFLVQSVLTCCSPRGSDNNFVDEFKLKLPLDLSPAVKGQSLRSFCLFFTVYDVKLGPRSKWKKAKKLFSGSEENQIEDDTVSRAEPLATGFFPIARDGCLVDDGIHQIKMLYKSEEPSDEMLQSGMMDKTSLILFEKLEIDVSQSTAEDANLSVDNLSRDISHTGSTGSASDFALNQEDSRIERGRSQIEPMTFSLRVCSSSSLHSSNPVLSHYLKEEGENSNREEDLNKNGFLSKISMGRDLLLEASTTRVPSGEEDKLLKSTLEIVKYSVCPITRSYGFLVRIMTRLWRKLVMGTGIPSLAWSNPATPIPLRLHAFASILQLLGGSSLFLSKNGLTQGDGSKFSIVALARVVALWFDEENLFDSEELFDINFLVKAVRSQEVSSAKKSGSSRRKRHVRNNFDLYDLQASPDSIGSLSSTSSPSHARRKSDIPVTRSSDIFGSDFSSDINPLHRAQEKGDVKIDSKSDFQSALRAAVAAEDDFDKPESDGSHSAKAMIQAFGGTNAGNRRWMTAPTRALTTIREGDDTDLEEPARASVSMSKGTAVGSASVDSSNTDNLDGEIQRNIPKTSVKQMRIPRGRKSSSATFDLGSIEFNDTMASNSEGSVAETKPQSVPKTDEEIESAGTAFLDVLGKNLGFDVPIGEEGSAGSSHHRKTRSRSSIDWTLIGSGDGFVPSFSQSDIDSDTRDFTKDNNELTSLKRDERKSVLLPDFADRLAALEKQSAYHARWFPYAYEVIILQWAAILVEQRALGERLRPDRGWKPERSGEAPDESMTMDDGIAEAATRAIGVAVAGAPLLFELIKESLGFRINSLFKVGIAKGATWTSPPLVVLDETLFLGLEQVISMVADACIDSRNFDSWELRQMSIDVNDSIIRFLRSMFSFLSPKTVHRLILTYISRFVTKEGKHWQDRDSAIGLRCSWEITKLRLNAISGLVRFPDFVKVNSPQMLNWSNWWEPSFSRSDLFFDDILKQYRGYSLPDFCAEEGSSQHIKIDTPAMHPHWLSELCIDICMLGTEHAEPQIQQRSASLIHEMFWMCSQKGTLTRSSAPIATMLMSFVWKMLSRVNYLSNFAPKSQLRKDLLPCAVYVLQSAPGNLLRAMWRKLCTGLRTKGSSDRYGGFSSVRTRSALSEASPRIPRLQLDVKDDPDVLDMFSLLNLALKTVEYEGSEEQMEQDGAGASRDNVHLWQKEFLPSESELSASDVRSMRRIDDPENSHSNDTNDHPSTTTSSISRRWFSHDSSLVVINAGHQMVWELYRILCATPEGVSHLNPSVQPRDTRSQQPGQSTQTLSYTHSDISVFVRAASSLYLHALSLRQSDVVIIRTFKISAELIKIFGIKTFLEGVGDTLQHWMRVISLQCGARRAAVRIEATDLLELILRSTWHGYGSFFRIRVPLLAVQTEVMERIVATAASRYYRDQRRLGATFEPFSNVNAEASLVPLWRTLDRIEKQPASQNVAFRGALVRIAGKLKKLYRAYIAARVLSYIHGSGSSDNWDEDGSIRDHATEAIIRANRISILRVLNASEGHSKQFLGFHATTQQRSRVAHFEAVEDSLLDAADVFSPTELPEHRVAWLRMLADFHAGRGRYAEEATCHFHIHVTLQHASRLHGSLWSNTPFLPWTDNIPDPVYIDVDTPAGDPDYTSDFDFDDQGSGYGQAVNSFRRIFYRVANSVAINSNEWDTAANRTLFCGITTAQEYNSSSGWSTLRDMEDQMVEHAEHSADLFLKAGIVESSRFAWNLATQFYASKFNYAKLAMAYRNLERCVVSSVPPIDASLPQEVSATLGRFYRVWFHGGAPDELIGTEFVYRTEGDGRLETFGQDLLAVIKSIIPDNTPIHIVLDGRTEERIEENGSTSFFNRLGPTPLEPVRIKITPLRPLFDRNSRTRGLPEWFYRYADEAFEKLHHRSTNEIAVRNDRSKGSPGANDGFDPHHREHGRTYSASIFSSSGSVAGGSMTRRGMEERGPRPGFLEEDELSGVDKFCFVQPKDRSRSKDWWKNTGSEYADKTLKVTQLQVAQSFPACVARQPVVHRLVYSQSPLEAGIDSVCQWCAVLFRTAVATVGMAVLGTNQDDPGIGTDAVKVVADCIHSSHVKEIGMAFMKKYTDSKDGDSSNAPLSLESYDRLSEFECHKLQVKLARLIIVFVELLHLLIARNRQMLLDFMQERKRNEMSSQNAGLRVPNLPKSGSSIHDQGSRRSRRGGSSQGSQDTPTASAPTSNAAPRNIPVPPVPDRNIHRREASLSDYMSNRQRFLHRRSSSEADQQSIGSTHASGGKGESAIAVQSELQRAFINMAKSLYPKIQAILQGETPRWLKQCAQDTYFSMGTYKQTTLPIDEELCYTAESLNPPTSAFSEAPHHPTYDRMLGSTNTSPRNSVGGSEISRGSVYSQPQQGII